MRPGSRWSTLPNIPNNNSCNHLDMLFMDLRLSLSEKKLGEVEKLDVCWWEDMDQCNHINVYNHTEQTLNHNLTQ